MKIEAVETSTFRVPLAREWGDQTHRVRDIELVVTEVTSDSGLVGTGFSYSVGMGGKAIEALLTWYLAPYVIGADVAPRPLWNRMWHHAHDAGGGGITTMAIAAIDIALWDLACKAQKRSLVNVLGQHRASIDAYGSGVNLNLTFKELEEQVRGWIGAGYRSIKIKVGKPDLTEDVERVALVRKLAGPHMPLMVDANQGWDVTSACRAINALERFELFWVEEPILSDDIEGHARLRRSTNAQLAVGENVYTQFQFNQYLMQGSCDFIQADVVRVGGITPWLAIAELARTWSVPIAPHFLLEISGQLLCCVSNGAILEDVQGGSFRELGVLLHDLGTEAGRFVPPTRPGHGIEFDLAKLEPFRLTEPERIARGD